VWKARKGAQARWAFSSIAGVLLLFAMGCRSKSSTPAATESTSTASPSAENSAPLRPARESRTRIETASFDSGTVPGTFNRDPELEPALSSLALGPFEIDLLPFPNDPDKPPLLVDSQEKAAALCAEREGRLCTELEWERGCKGPKSSPFSSGEQFSCGSLLSCRSREGLYGLGLQREWTASRFGEAKNLLGKPVWRGADSSEPVEMHRCAHRQAAAPATAAAFRCCYGPPNGAKVVEPQRDFVFRKTELSKERLNELLAAHAQTRALGTAATLFREPEAARTVVDRGPGDRQGFGFTVAPLLWKPVAGASFLAVAGKANDETSFVAVYHVLGDDRYELASSFIMHDEAGPVAFAYSESIEPRFHFSTCWGCPGDTGKVLYRKPDSAVIVQP
jgi:hypothetical protein